MNAGGPPRDGIYLTRHSSVWVMTGQAHLAIRTVPNQEILRDGIFSLHVRIVTRCALNVSIDELYGAGWVSRLALRSKRGDKIDAVLHGENKTDGM
jgi:hypothetical protein